MNLLRNLRAILCVLICLMPISATADVIIKSFKADLVAEISLTYGDGTSQDLSSRVKSNSLLGVTFAELDADYTNDGDPHVAWAYAEYKGYDSLEYFGVYSKVYNDETYDPNSPLSKEGSATVSALATAQMVFRAEGDGDLFRGGIVDFEYYRTAGRVFLRDLTAGTSVIDFSLADGWDYTNTNATLIDGHVYKVQASTHMFGGDEEIYACWSFDGVTSVPEPGTLALFAFGLFGMGLTRRKKV